LFYRVNSNSAVRSVHFLGSSFFQKRTEEFSYFSDKKRQQTTLLIDQSLTAHDMKFL